MFNFNINLSRIILISKNILSSRNNCAKIFSFLKFSTYIFADQLVYVQGAAATPVELLRAMTDYGVRCDVRNVRLYHMHLEGAAPFAKPENASTSM